MFEGRVLIEEECGKDTNEIINGAIIHIDIAFEESDVWVKGDEIEDFGLNSLAWATPRGGGFNETEIVRNSCCEIVVRINGLHLLIFYYI
tara:strand:- start:190 stop:459 length:270 start_codon:yes stop_codon:yes gene_type:complete